MGVHKGGTTRWTVVSDSGCEGPVKSSGSRDSVGNSYAVHGFGFQEVSLLLCIITCDDLHGRCKGDEHTLSIFELPRVNVSLRQFRGPVPGFVKAAAC